MSPIHYRVRHDVIRLQLERRGMLRGELALKAQIDPKTVTNLLKPGRRFSMATIAKLAKALQCNVETLLELEHGPNSTATADAVHRVEISIKIVGLVPEVASGQLALTAQQIATAVRETGIVIQSLETNVSTLAPLTVDDICRTIYLLHGLMESGDPYWVYCAVKPSRTYEFEVRIQEQTLDLKHFSEFGEVIVSGEGPDPPHDVITKVAERYRIEKAVLLAGGRSTKVVQK